MEGNGDSMFGVWIWMRKPPLHNRLGRSPGTSTSAAPGYARGETLMDAIVNFTAVVLRYTKILTAADFSQGLVALSRLDLRARQYAHRFLESTPGVPILGNHRTICTISRVYFNLEFMLGAIPLEAKG